MNKNIFTTLSVGKMCTTYSVLISLMRTFVGLLDALTLIGANGTGFEGNKRDVLFFLGADDKIYSYSMDICLRIQKTGMALSVRYSLILQLLIGMHYTRLVNAIPL